MTNFLEYHPGGDEVLLEASGKNMSLYFFISCSFLPYVAFVCSGYICTRVTFFNFVLSLSWQRSRPKCSSIPLRDPHCNHGLGGLQWLLTITGRLLVGLI